MVLNKGGYVMINKAQDNVYELATSALTSGKPILWYETNTECYFIDTVKLSGTDIILTKGGKTITIENDGDITETGDVQSHLYAYLFYLTDSSSSVYYFNYKLNKLVSSSEELFNLLNNTINDGLVMETAGDGVAHISCGFSGDLETGFDVLTDDNDVFGSVGGTFITLPQFSNIKIVKLF